MTFLKPAPDLTNVVQRSLRFETFYKARDVKTISTIALSIFSFEYITPELPPYLDRLSLCPNHPCQPTFRPKHQPYTSQPSNSLLLHVRVTAPNGSCYLRL
jgi:hypothetical protein